VKKLTSPRHVTFVVETDKVRRVLGTDEDALGKLRRGDPDEVISAVVSVVVLLFSHHSCGVVMICLILCGQLEGEGGTHHAWLVWQNYQSFFGGA